MSLQVIDMTCHIDMTYVMTLLFMPKDILTIHTKCGDYNVLSKHLILGTLIHTKKKTNLSSLSHFTYTTVLLYQFSFFKAALALPPQCKPSSCAFCTEILMFFHDAMFCYCNFLSLLIAIN